MYQQENIDFEKFKKRPRFLFNLLFYIDTDECRFSEVVEADSFEKAKEKLFSEIITIGHCKVKIERVWLEIYNEEN